MIDHSVIQRSRDERGRPGLRPSDQQAAGSVGDRRSQRDDQRVPAFAVVGIGEASPTLAMEPSTALHTTIAPAAIDIGWRGWPSGCTRARALVHTCVAVNTSLVGSGAHEPTCGQPSDALCVNKSRRPNCSCCRPCTQRWMPRACRSSDRAGGDPVTDRLLENMLAYYASGQQPAMAPGFA
jgi:hypothetical protein